MSLENIKSFFSGKQVKKIEQIANSVDSESPENLAAELEAEERILQTVIAKTGESQVQDEEQSSAQKLKAGTTDVSPYVAPETLDEIDEENLEKIVRNPELATTIGGVDNPDAETSLHKKPHEGITTNNPHDLRGEY